MKQQIYLEDEFKDFLQQVHNIKRNYISVLAHHKYLIPQLNIENIETLVKNNEVQDLYSIKFPIYSKKFKISKGYYNDFKSACRKYQEFLVYYSEQKLASETDEENEEESFESFLVDDNDLLLEDETEFSIAEEKEVYDTNFIKSNFTFRLITQNRFNRCGLYFPISFLKQYFYKTGDAKYFDKRISEQLKRIKLFYKQDRFMYLSDVSDIKLINGNKLIFKCNDKNYHLCSHNLETESLEEFVIEKFSDIAIDHMVSMNTILEEIKRSKISGFEQLQMISNELRKSLKKPISYKKLIAKGTRLSNDMAFIGKINKDKLKKEYEGIISMMDLQLMHRKHNNFKRAKI